MLSTFLGLMSGSSLDGLDIVACQFAPLKNNKLSFNILCAETLIYKPYWRQLLSRANQMEGAEMEAMDQDYGTFLAESVIEFIHKYKLKPDLIGSHGHTVRHKPQIGISLQIGHGKTICKMTGIPVVNNFRYQDVLMGGQGAPLVPIGDEYLFSEYDFCLNLGGFSNISFSENGVRKACDLSPCNILLNELSAILEMEYDPEGSLAAQGQIIPNLLEKWQSIPYYKLSGPKSLGREWFLESFINDIRDPAHSTYDLLRTATEHISCVISEFLLTHSGTIPKRVLVTGGGTYNHFLIARLKEKTYPNIEWILPDKLLINYKEALIFALLAKLRMENQINVLASVTGATHDHSAGDIWTMD
ncbi:MAG: anhydro-N-acetylmuramic acid kinase [Saprospiraceae bacterium]|nr:anhydro-N-acetylmuramic acid kinase [Saprospiraceae bacterium]